MPKDDPIKRKPDISLAKEKLGWEPKINLEKGENTIEENVNSVKQDLLETMD